MKPISLIFLAMAMFIVSACEKDPEPEPDPNVYIAVAAQCDSCIVYIHPFVDSFGYNINHRDSGYHIIADTLTMQHGDSLWVIIAGSQYGKPNVLNFYEVGDPHPLPIFIKNYAQKNYQGFYRIP